jgi:hypothetical protein
MEKSLNLKDGTVIGAEVSIQFHNGDILDTYFSFGEYVESDLMYELDSYGQLDFTIYYYWEDGIERLEEVINKKELIDGEFYILRYTPRMQFIIKGKDNDDATETFDTSLNASNDA